MTKQNILDDLHLIKRIKLGGKEGEKAKKDLYNACKSYSYNYLMGDKLKMAQEEAQEIFSEAIVAIFFAILNDKFEKKSSFRTFYTSILNNKLKDFLGRKHKLQNINWEDKTTLDSRTSEREEELSDKEGFQLVVRIFTSLAAQTLPQDFLTCPTKNKSILLFEEIECLNYYRMRTEGFSWEVIAERKNETIEAVKKKEGRCLEKSRKFCPKNFPESTKFYYVHSQEKNLEMDESIKKYLAQEMDEQEIEWFEAKMAQDDTLRKDVEELAASQEAIEKFQRYMIRKQLEAYEDESDPTDSNDDDSLKNWRKYLFSFLILFTILGGAYYSISNKSNTTELDESNTIELDSLLSSCACPGVRGSYPQPVPALSKICKIFNNRDYQKAITFFQDSLSTDPDSVHTYTIVVAMAYYKMGNEVQAIASLREVETNNYDCHAFAKTFLQNIQTQ